MDKIGKIVIDDCSGGLNGNDSPVGPGFKPNQVTSANNVEWFRTRVARKRRGSANVSMTGSSMADYVWALARHVPGTTEADAELWALDQNQAIYRLDNSATWTTPATIVDLPTTTAEEEAFTSASLNGLFFMAYKAATGSTRLHVYDSTADTIRRTGVYQGTTAPTVADTGAGTYAATLRYYRVRFASNATGSSYRVSEPTPSVSFTPSGAGTAARITRPTTPSDEQIVSWIAEGSSDNVTFYVISGASGIAIATTTFDDSVAPANYAANYALSAATGTYTLQKPYRFIAADNNRLLGFGSYTSTDPQSRIEFSAIVGSSGLGDAERVDTTNLYYYDLDDKDSGVPTALVGPLWGNFYPFKSRQMWELSPTGSVTNPYRLTPIAKTIGCVDAHAAVIGEDDSSNPCLYFMSARGLYRYGVDGLKYMSTGIDNFIIGPDNTMNLAATINVCHMVYHSDKRQLWVWIAVDTEVAPTHLYVLNVETGGWAKYDGDVVNGARCSVMFARSIGATMGRTMTPYIGSLLTQNVVVRLDEVGATQDAGSTNYRATVTTGVFEPGGPGYNGIAGDPIVTAKSLADTTLTVELIPDFRLGLAKSGTVSLAAEGSETSISRRVDGVSVGNAQFVSVRIGDPAAANTPIWSLDRITIPTMRQEPVAGL